MKKKKTTIPSIIKWVIALILVGTLAFVVVENSLADTDALGCHLDKFVTLDVFKTFLKTHKHLRYDARLFIRTARTHIRELLCLRHVDDKVVVMHVLAHHLTGIDLFSRVNEELSAVLQFVYTVCICRSCLHSYHRYLPCKAGIP